MTEQSYIDLARAVQRERETEQRVRAMDASDIVEEIHRLEDALKKADAEYNRLREVNAELLAALDPLVDAIDEMQIAAATGNLDLVTEKMRAVFPIRTKGRAAIARAKGEDA